MLKHIFILLILLLLISGYSIAQINNESGLSILCIAAHPDDEDGAALAYYSKLKGYNAYTIVYTRGEGGQNEIGPELYDELGRIRERETMEAAEIQGSEAYFLGFLDFGYSKTAKETFNFWGGKDIVLARLVYMIRTIQPDVIITNHDTITTKPEREHGHHQAAGITVYEAFEKAADTSYHPENFDKSISHSIFLQGGHTTQEIKVYTKPWQVKKLFFRVYDTTKTTGIVKINITQKDESGKTIHQLSYDALAKHRTQGMDKIDYVNTMSSFAARRYELIMSDKEYPFDSTDLFTGLTSTSKSKVMLESFPTQYTYRILSTEDSLSILNSLQFPKSLDIGLFKTYDNTIETILKTLQIKYDTLTPNSLGKTDLKKYNTIILDLRAYFYRTELSENNSFLLSYANDGGNLVCFYHKPGDWNDKNFSPYPIYLTSERVTEEDAFVTLLHPNHKFFTAPNLIRTNNWNNWIQERNIYLPSDDTAKTSSKYMKLLSMNDEDDPVPSTSLLWAEYGKGTYTYVSLALYRQLKIFNTGSLKLFLNIISQNRR